MLSSFGGLLDFITGILYILIYHHYELRRLDMNNVISNSYFCLFISTTIGQISMAAKQIA